MKIRRGQIYDHTLSRDVVSKGLQGCCSTQETLFYSNVSQADQVDSYSSVQVHLNRDPHGLNAYALGTVNTYQHIICLFSRRLP